MDDMQVGFVQQTELDKGVVKMKIMIEFSD